VAVYFRGLAQLLSEKTKIGKNLSLAIVIAGTLVILGGLGWLLGAKIQQQAAMLSNTIPQKTEAIKQQLSQNQLGQQILKQVGATTGNGIQQDTVQKIRGLFRTTFGVLGDVYVILFMGIFFIAAPRLYINGMVTLIPPGKRQRGRKVINKLGKTLRSWLIGKIFAMIVVAILTAIGLKIIGVPLALVLALIAGLLNFIPNFGPLIAMVPAVLMGLSVNPQTALIVAILYVAIQVVESNFITPFIQLKLIQIPPALIIIGQLVMGILVGGWGIILATPLVAIVMVLVQELYIKDALGDEDFSTSHN
jgi:predicted PurR-regulated permease PerM